MRLEPRSGERIDRSKPVSFSFAGWKVAGFEGDTLGSAAFAAGKRVFSRSFKYHRPRGLLCCSGHCPNCLMTVDGVPNVRVCTEPIREGAVVEGQNVRWSLDFDFMSVTDKVGGPFTPVGFYYRTFIRPRRLWPFYEKFLRSAAGLGELDEHAGYSRRYDTEHRKARVLVVGGGPAGRAAALAAAASGDGVVLVDEDASLNGMQLDGVEVLAPARALGIWEGGLVPVDAGTVLYRFRAARIIVATGAIEQPLVFPGNDLIGVMLPGGVRRLVNDFSIKPGNRAIVVAADDEGFEVADDLSEAGVAVPRVIDLRETRPRELVAQGGKGRVRRLVVDGESFDCDLLVASGGRQPAYSLLAQAGARIEFDSELGVFVPTELPSGVEAVGSVTGDGLGKVDPEPAYGGKGKCFVCVCEDVTTKDMKRAIAEGLTRSSSQSGTRLRRWGPARESFVTCRASGSIRRRPGCTRRRSGRPPHVRRGLRSSSACSRAASSPRHGARRCTGLMRRRERRSSGQARGNDPTPTARSPKTRFAPSTSRSV